MVNQVLEKAKAAGVNIRVESGKLIAGPREAITPDLGDLIRRNRDALLALLSSPVTLVTDVTDSGDERRERAENALQARRAKVLALLKATAGTRLAFIVDDPDSDPVVVSVALRKSDRVITFEIEIPQAKYDAFNLWELAERHGAPKGAELAVLEGGKSKSQDQAKRLDSEPEAA